MLLLFLGAISHPDLLQMRKKTKIDWSEIIQNTSKKASCNQGLKLALKAIREAGEKLFYDSKIWRNFFVSVATPAVALQQRCHMDPLDASVGTPPMCDLCSFTACSYLKQLQVKSTFGLLRVGSSTVLLNKCVWGRKSGCCSCEQGNTMQTSRQLLGEKGRSWNAQAGCEKLRPASVVHAIFCRLHCSFSVVLNRDISLIFPSL